MHVSNHGTVLCRSLGDEPLVRIAWSTTEEGILISTPESFHLWEEAGSTPLLVLAPADTVYKYSEGLFHQLDEAFRHAGNNGAGLEQLWRQAKPYGVTEINVDQESPEAVSGAITPESNVCQESPKAVPIAMSTARIKVIGVGGAGCNAVSRMVREQVHGVEFIAMNTDAKHLAITEAALHVQLGERIARGLGAGGDHLFGQRAAEESREEIKQVVTGADIVFIAAGMGGGTGTGSAPVVAEIAKQGGALTIAVVTKPFSFEGARRSYVAEDGLSNLIDKVDALIITPNDCLLEANTEKTSMDGAFKLADEVLATGVQSIVELITVPGLINLDLADIRVVMKDAGVAWMSVGRGSGENGTTDAAKEARYSRLTDASMAGAKAVLFNVTASSTLTMFDVNNAAQIIQQAADPAAKIFFGIVIDPNMGNDIRLTLIATGFATQYPLAGTPLEKEIPDLSTQVKTEGKFEVPSFLRHWRGLPRRKVALSDMCTAR